VDVNDIKLQDSTQHKRIDSEHKMKDSEANLSPAIENPIIGGDKKDEESMMMEVVETEKDELREQLENQPKLKNAAGEDPET
jgi:hypothetical protein